MIGIDTNILIYARVKSSTWHVPAVAFLESLRARRDVAIAELVLVEFYLALRNSVIMDPPLSPKAAVQECSLFREHPHWPLIENAEVMHEVWSFAGKPQFARRRIMDVRLAKTLIAHGVTEFATANLRDFQDLGFSRVWNPLAGHTETLKS